jgi:pimeloyl-ACP methyl ester carboxylesterase
MSKPIVRHPLVLLIVCLTAVAFAARGAGAAQVAASIEYTVVPRPQNLPAEMAPLPGATLRFLSIKTLDGYTMQAALWQAEGKAPAATTIFVQVHGSGANFTELPLRAIARAFSARGYAALTISTRQHDEHVNTDNFFDVRHDIEAAVATAKALGYKTIILEGHSLGTVQMEYYAATTWDPAVKAVILTGPFGNLPWKSRNIIIQNDEAYKALAEASAKALQAGHAGDLLPIKMPYLGGTQTPVTAQHFLTYRDERTSAADGTYWIRRIPYPILLARDQSDGVVLPFEPYMLLSAAHAEGSLVPSISYVIVPDTHPTSAAGHIFTDNTPALIDTVTHWLAEQHL